MRQPCLMRPCILFLLISSAAYGKQINYKCLPLSYYQFSHLGHHHYVRPCHNHRLLIQNYVLFVLCSVTQLCPTFCNSKDCSRLGSSVHEIIPARILEVGWHFLLEGFSQPRDQTHISCVSCIDWRILYH